MHCASALYATDNYLQSDSSRSRPPSYFVRQIAGINTRHTLHKASQYFHVFIGPKQSVSYIWNTEARRSPALATYWFNQINCFFRIKKIFAACRVAHEAPEWSLQVFVTVCKAKSCMCIYQNEQRFFALCSVTKNYKSVKTSSIPVFQWTWSIHWTYSTGRIPLTDQINKWFRYQLDNSTAKKHDDQPVPRFHTSLYRF